jgi:hypothetical protein
MRAPRIETLLISLVLLVAAGVALAAAYAPSTALPRHADPGQERAHETPPSPGTNRLERPGSALQEATHAGDDGIPPLPDISIDAQRATAGVTIVGGIVTLVLVVAIARQRIGKVALPRWRTTGPGVPALIGYVQICACLGETHSRRHYPPPCAAVLRFRAPGSQRSTQRLPPLRMRGASPVNSMCTAISIHSCRANSGRYMSKTDIPTRKHAFRRSTTIAGNRAPIPRTCRTHSGKDCPGHRP